MGSPVWWMNTIMVLESMQYFMEKVTQLCEITINCKDSGSCSNLEPLNQCLSETDELVKMAPIHLTIRSKLIVKEMVSQVVWYLKMHQLMLQLHTDVIIAPIQHPHNNAIHSHSR
jgi:hypothetical protein